MDDFMEQTVIAVVVGLWLMPFGLRLMVEIFARL